MSTDLFGAGFFFQQKIRARWEDWSCPLHFCAKNVKSPRLLCLRKRKKCPPPPWCSWDMSVAPGARCTKSGLATLKHTGKLTQRCRSWANHPPENPFSSHKFLHEKHLNIALSMVVSLYFGGKSHVSNGQNVSFEEPCKCLHGT